MAITYKERSTYVKKETIDGNEKIVVDGTQYITPDQILALALSTLSNPTSITLDSSAARTYQVCSITSRTSITLSIVKQNAGYEHYILFTNTGSSECALALPSGSIAPAATITVPAGKSIELSYIYNGSKVVFTASAALTAL